jgi:hypothetical protein
MQLAILRRRNPREYLHLGDPAAAGISQHIEVAQQRFAIGQNGDLAAAFASARRTLRSIKGLGKVQVQLVHARLQGNVVAEISLPAAAIDDRILCPPNMLDRARDSRAASEVGARPIPGQTVFTKFAIDSVTSMRVENRPGHLFGGCRLRVLGFPAHGGCDTGAAAGMVVKNELLDRAWIEFSVLSQH